MYWRHTLTLDEVKTALNIRELQRKQNVIENGTEEWLTTTGKYDKRDGKKKNQGK